MHLRKGSATVRLKVERPLSSLGVAAAPEPGPELPASGSDGDAQAFHARGPGPQLDLARAGASNLPLRCLNRELVGLGVHGVSGMALHPAKSNLVGIAFCNLC